MKFDINKYGENIVKKKFEMEIEIPNNSEAEFNQIMEWVRDKSHNDRWKFVKRASANNDFLMWKLKKKMAAIKPGLAKI
ncbi:MAG: hypothetical protein NTU57_01530 [Candidatus Aenigmarchaeota archaeon]|nr:hypothetical protein [Candidatus Aenigmarchaeota archaeon]